VAARVKLTARLEPQGPWYLRLTETAHVDHDIHLRVGGQKAKLSSSGRLQKQRTQAEGTGVLPQEGHGHGHKVRMHLRAGNRSRLFGSSWQQ